MRCAARLLLSLALALPALAGTAATEESALLARVRALASPAAAPALIRAIRATGAVIPRLREALVHLTVERALELDRERPTPALPATLDALGLPPHTRAMLRSARPDAWPGGSLEGLPAAVDGPVTGTGARAEALVLFVVDGLRRDILDGMLARGKLPNIRAHLLERGLTVDRLVSVFPSVTPPNAATLLTGVLPDRHRIPALAWYDRQCGTARLYTSVRGRDMNRDLPPAETTLWERLRDRFEVATVSMPLERGAWHRWFHMFWPDRAVARLGDSYLGRRGYLPPVLGMWFLDLDSASHLGGTFSPAVERALEKLDAELGRVVETLKRRGLYDKTLIAWVSDHGSQPTLKNVDIVGDLARAGLPCRTLDLSVDPFFPAAMGWRLKGAPAVAINLGAGTGSLYLRGGPTPDVIAKLIDHPAVDVVMHVTAPDRFRVVSRAGAAEITRSRVGEVTFGYRVVTGADPLGVPPALHGAPRTLGEWVRGTSTALRPVAVPGIAAFLASGRGGDVAFTARPGVNFSRHFHTRGGYHGGLTAGEMVTRMLIAGPGVPRARVAAGSVADVAPTLLTLLGVPYGAGMDGRSLVSPPAVASAVADAPVGAGLDLAAARDAGDRARRIGAARGAPSGDRARLAYAPDPDLAVHQLFRVPDWRLGASADTAPWWPLLLPAAVPGSALQVDFRRPAGRADVVLSPGLLRTSRAPGASERIRPTLDLRACVPLAERGRSWIGLAAGAEALGGAGGRLRGRSDAGLLVTHSVNRKLRGFAFAGGFAGSALDLHDAQGLKLKGGVELFLGDQGTVLVEAVREERGAGDVSLVGGVVNLAAF